MNWTTFDSRGYIVIYVLVHTRHYNNTTHTFINHITSNFLDRTDYDSGTPLILERGVVWGGWERG
jgi:hypothetical protein